MTTDATHDAMMSVLSPEAVNWLLGIPFGLLMISVLVWFVLMARLRRILRTRHPRTYDKVCGPTLSASQNSLATLRFLLTGHFRTLNDPELLRLGRFMQVFFLAYMILFVSLMALGFTFAPKPYLHGR